MSIGWRGQSNLVASLPPLCVPSGAQVASSNVYPLFTTWRAKFYASLCFGPTNFVCKCTCTCFHVSSISYRLQKVPNLIFILNFVVYNSAHHFSPGTQYITSSLCWALPAGIAPRHVVTGCPLPQPKPQQWKSPFSPRQAVSFPPLPPPFAGRTNALQPSALCKLVKPGPRSARDASSRPRPPRGSPQKAHPGLPLRGSPESQRGTAHVDARPGIKAALPP